MESNSTNNGNESILNTSAVLAERSPLVIQESFQSGIRALIEDGMLDPVTAWVGASRDAVALDTVNMLVIREQRDEETGLPVRVLLLNEDGRLILAPLIRNPYDNARHVFLPPEQYPKQEKSVIEALRRVREEKEAEQALEKAWNMRNSMIRHNQIAGVYRADVRSMRNNRNLDVRAFFSLLHDREVEELERELPNIDFDRPHLYIDESEFLESVRANTFSRDRTKGDVRMSWSVSAARNIHTSEKYHITVRVVKGKGDSAQEAYVMFGENGRLFKGKDWNGEEIDLTLNRADSSFSPKSRRLEALLKTVVDEAKQVHILDTI